MNHVPPLHLRCALRVATALGLALPGCSEPPRSVYTFDAGTRDATVLDVAVPADAAETVACTAGAAFTLGPVELNAGNVDLERAQVIARPGAEAEFLALTARAICPTVCDGSDPDEGPENFAMRRALIFTVPGDRSAPPGEPIVVNLGTGLTGDTATVAPVMAPVGDRLVVAWLDTALSEAQNVWAQSVDLATLSPDGTRLKVSNIASPDGVGRLALAPGAGSEAVAVYETIADPPVRRRATISDMGVPLTDAELGPAPEGPGHFALHRQSSGPTLMGHSEWTTKPFCDLLVGVEGGAQGPVQQDPAARACGPFSIADGAVAYGAVSAGLDVILFRPLTSEGAPSGFERKVVGGAGRSALLPALAAFRGGYVLAYVERTDTSSTLRAALLTRHGEITNDFELETVPTDVSQPSLSVSNDGASIAIAWQERGAEGDATRLLRVECE